MPAEHTTPTEHRPEFSATLRAAIDARRVTLAWLRERLAASGNPVAAATLSYWRSGARRPEGAQSLAAVEQLETLLGLDTGTLLSQIGPNQRVGPIGTPQYPLEQARLEQATTETFIALGAPAMDPGRDVSTTAVTEVAVDGSVISRTTRTLLQCTSGTITNVPYLDLTPGVRTPAPIFSVVSGGHISRRHSHPSGEVHGAMFELERPLGRRRRPCWSGSWSSRQGIRPLMRPGTASHAGRANWCCGPAFTPTPCRHGSKRSRRRPPPRP
ncbi:hypothetical protein LG322_15120 [Microbacterium aerolatum]|uniref:hypothetical protein n=1 Tax=Microbacterium aerolatum TaxID=153731 RepID=UPI00384AF2AC